ncbi:hypothetical protein BB559_004263 [Furculomyces boomerangus]|uniref:Uncharacterized protein n=1 Tax=Furculomyces boomerangus TaxID=61424 RepID=A0A2T9Y2D7_9FUNG|nr:hypothetical protein BB559_006510 [Furculomyces boomerangus]PVU91131.1 hypothetical protein BB559_004263 [Furculomyces boomerangus]
MSFFDFINSNSSTTQDCNVKVEKTNSVLTPISSPYFQPFKFEKADAFKNYQRKHTLELHKKSENENKNKSNGNFYTFATTSNFFEKTEYLESKGYMEAQHIKPPKPTKRLRFAIESPSNTKPRVSFKTNHSDKNPTTKHSPRIETSKNGKIRNNAENNFENEIKSENALKIKQIDKKNIPNYKTNSNKLGILVSPKNLENKGTVNEKIKSTLSNAIDKTYLFSDIESEISFFESKLSTKSENSMEDNTTENQNVHIKVDKVSKEIVRGK